MMKNYIKIIFAIILFLITFQIQSQEEIEMDTMYFDISELKSIPDDLGVLSVETSVSELSNSYARYVFTQKDALWMARFVTGESGVKNDANGHAVLWTMFNRFGILRHKVKSWSSFHFFLQSYSTTLQPFMKSKGAAKRVWKNYEENPDDYPIVEGEGTYKNSDIKKVQYKKHREIQEMNWTDIHINIRRMVIDILRGEISNPGIGIATEFASTRIYYKQKYGKFPTDEQWENYTIDYAKNKCKKKIKGCTWIGYKDNLYQKKNAFFIDNRFENVPMGSIQITN